MILFQIIQKPQKRGAEIFAAQLSEHLEKLGHTVILISLFEGDSELPFSGKKIQLNRPISKRWFDYEAWKEIARLVKEFKPDIIQCNAGDTLKFMILSKLFFGWKVPVIARNASTVSQYIQNPVVKKINGWLYKKTSAIISVSQHSKEDLIKLFPKVTYKTKVIPIGIESILLKEVQWQQKLNDSFHIVHVGGFTFEKNHEGLLRIFKDFLKSRPNSHLHLLGDGPKKKAIQELSKSLGILDKITFYGFVSNPVDYINKADIVVLPSIIEGLPGVILEAMYSKTPVIAYDVGGVSEVVTDQTGFLIPKNDEVAFVNAMLNLEQHPNKELLLETAHKMVVEKYNNEVLAKAFLNSYLEVAGFETRAQSATDWSEAE